LKGLKNQAECKINSAGQPVFLCFTRLQEQRGQRGAEGQRIESRDHRGNGDGESELLVELSGEAFDKRGWE